MKIFGFLDSRIEGLVFDIDNTVYPRPAEYFKEGSRRELEGAASAVGMPFVDFQRVFEAKRREISEQEGRKAAVTETVNALGVTPKQWSDLRLVAWRPEKWIHPDQQISVFFSGLADRYRIAFGTNSPIEIGWRVLRIIGIAQAVPSIKVFGPEVLGASKPEPQFFLRIAEELGLTPASCLSIGDREFSDGPPAISAGYAGAIVVPGSRDEVVEIIPSLFKGNWTALNAGR